MNKSQMKDDEYWKYTPTARTPHNISQQHPLKTFMGIALEANSPTEAAIAGFKN